MATKLSCQGMLAGILVDLLTLKYLWFLFGHIASKELKRVLSIENLCVLTLAAFAEVVKLANIDQGLDGLAGGDGQECLLVEASSGDAETDTCKVNLRVFSSN